MANTIYKQAQLSAANEISVICHSIVDDIEKLKDLYTKNQHNPILCEQISRSMQYVDALLVVMGKSPHYGPVLKKATGFH